MIPTTHVQVKKKLKTYSLKHKTYMCVKILDFLIAKFWTSWLNLRGTFLMFLCSCFIGSLSTVFICLLVTRWRAITIHTRQH